MILTENGVLKLMQRIKSFITSQLNTKASSVHTHSISEIENLESQLGGGGTLLAGSNQISGDLIPSTDNTIDIGSSSKKIKSVFANYLNNINLSTLFDISNAGYIANLNNSTLRVAGKVVVCSYNTNSSNNPTPQASGLCFTLANQDSSNFGVQVAVSNKGIYARFINESNYGVWGTIIK